MFFSTAKKTGKHAGLLCTLSLAALVAGSPIGHVDAAAMVDIPSDIGKLGPNMAYSARYSAVDAAAMAYFSHMVFYASYEPRVRDEATLRREYRQSLRKAGFRLVNASDSLSGLIAKSVRETDFFVFGTNRATFLVFRGTENPFQGITNIVDTAVTANSMLANRPGVRGKIHPGYHDAYQGTHQRVRRALGQFDRSKPLYITGHSLGGALATVAAYKLYNDGVRNIRGVYPLASPRVGNHNFTNDYERKLGSKTYRIKRLNDHVSEIPFYGFGPLGLGDYEHIGPYRLIRPVGSRYRIDLVGLHDDEKNHRAVLPIAWLMANHHSRDDYFLPMWQFAERAITDREIAKARAKARAKDKAIASAKAKAKARAKAIAAAKAKLKQQPKL